MLYTNIINIQGHSHMSEQSCCRTHPTCCLLQLQRHHLLLPRLLLLPLLPSLPQWLLVGHPCG
jgi:hypothetical protein